VSVNSKRMMTIITATIMIGLVSITTQTATGQSNQNGGTLVWIVSQDFSRINSAVSSSLVGANIVWEQIGNSLVGRNPDGSAAPELAQSWSVSSDGLQITFNLVRNATWHDGVPFTSADVKFTFEQAAMKYHPMGPILFTPAIKEILTPDDYTVVMQLKIPAAPMLPPFPFFSAYGGAIIPKHLYEGTDILTNPYNEKPVGTGPFIFKEWVKGDHLTVERNPNYWRKGLPHFDRIVFKIVPDSSARILALQTGEGDYMVQQLGGPDTLKMMNTPNVEVFAHQLGATCNYVIELNNADPILKNPDVRKALYMAIDRTAIWKSVYLSFGSVADNFFSKSPGVMWAYNHNVNLTQMYPFDPEAAKALLDKAGYPMKGENRFELTYDVQPGLLAYTKQAEVVRDYWNAIGIGLKLRTETNAAWLDRVYSKWDFQVTSSVSCNGPDPVLMAKYWSGSGMQHATYTNCVSYNNTVTNKAFADGFGELDPAKRAADYMLVQQQLALDLPGLPIWDYGTANFDYRSTKFAGWPAGDQDSRESLETVFLKSSSATTTAQSATASATTAITETKPQELSTTAFLAAIVVVIAAVGTVYYWRIRGKGKTTKEAA
jgi:peptide/nickel transport system substrate-binding protein